MRQHQFYKVELLVCGTKNVKDELNRMLNCAEEILKLLKIPYQIVFYHLVIWDLVQKKHLI